MKKALVAFLCLFMFAGMSLTADVKEISKNLVDKEGKDVSADLASKKYVIYHFNKFA